MSTTVVYTSPPEGISNTVLEALNSIIYVKDYLSDGTAQAYGTIIDDVYGSCVEITEDKEQVIDSDQYISELETLVWGLIRQRDLLFTALEANHQYAKLDGASQLIKQIGVETFKKMIIYCASEIDMTQSEHSRKFYTEENFRAACAFVPLLPIEWQERGAKFVEVYAANYYQTEFAGQKL